MKNVLMGTFVEGKMYPRKEIREIYEFFGADKIFVFSLTEDEGVKKHLLTFNVDEDGKKKLSDFKKKNKNTICLQRNRPYNVMYTINSLNEIIRVQNGSHSSKFKVDWSGYKNCLVLLDSNGKIKCLFAELSDVVETETRKNTEEML